MDSTGIALLAVAGLAGLPVLYALGRRDEARAQEQWSFLMSRWAQIEYDELKAELAQSVRAADHMHEAAKLMDRTGRRQALDLGMRVLVKESQTLFELLTMMLDLARRLCAIQPAPPLAPRRFSMRPVRLLARLHSVLHQLVVTTKERFAFRLYILGHAIRAVVRYMRREIGGTHPSREDTEAAWGDYHALNDETLESFRILLASMAAVPTEDRVERPAGVASIE